jgi:DNA-directed RNA polymerase subunit M/transcription elongation factor TFIIS
MLQPKEKMDPDGGNFGYLIYDCRTCGYSEQAKTGDEADNCVYKSEQTKMNDNLHVDVDCIKDPCLSRRTCRPCKKCKSTQAVTFINPTKDRMNLIFVCTNCTNNWRKDDLDENDVPIDEDSDE